MQTWDVADPLKWTILDPIVCCKEELQFFFKLAIRQPIQQKKRRSQPDSHGRTDEEVEIRYTTQEATVRHSF